MNQGTIYSLYCRETERYYVGQTIKGLNKRWKEHIYEANKMSPKPLYKAIRKYGAGSFTVRILEECDVTLLDERETYWIEHYNAYSGGYNQTNGAGGQYRISDDVKDRISATMTGKMKSEEHIENISKALKEKKHNFTVRGDGKHARRKVKTINVDTLEEKIHESIKSCGEYLGTEAQNISRALRYGWKVKSHRIIRLDTTPLRYAIYGVDKITNQVKYEFDSIRAAGKELGYNGGDSGCHKSLKHPHKYTWRGCYWFYKDEINKQ